MNKIQKFIPSLFSILLGVLFIILKGEVISIGMTVVGVVLVILTIAALIKGNIPSCVIYAVLAVLVFVAGWLFVTVALYIMAAILLIYGISQLYGLFSSKARISIGRALLLLIPPIFNIIAAVCLLFYQGETIGWVFTISGIFLIIDGVLSLIGLIDGKRR